MHFYEIIYQGICMGHDEVDTKASHTVYVFSPNPCVSLSECNYEKYVVCTSSMLLSIIMIVRSMRTYVQ
jgi:hypothetical protein